MTGIVIIGSNNRFLVKTDAGSLSCTFKGKVLKNKEQTYNTLAPGDRVEVEQIAVDAGLILSLHERQSLFWRFNEKGRAKQAIAANIDMAICVSSVGAPPWRPRFIDRVSVLAEMNAIPLLIILNKCDMEADEEILERMKSYEELGFLTLRTSIYKPETIVELKDKIRGQTVALIGQSGVGKSSLINALEPGLDYEIGDICEKYQRGKHTTVTAVLAPLSDKDTYIIDTPGIRRLALRYIDPLELSFYFPELHKLHGKCSLGARCSHMHEKGCAVLEQVEAGLIHHDRYVSYCAIRNELLVSREYTKKTGRPVRIYEDTEE